MLEEIDKKTNPFKVPENYFDNFNSQITDQLIQNKLVKNRIPVWKKAIPWSAVAAVAIGAMFYLGIVPDNRPDDMQQSASTQTLSLTEDDIIEYMEDEVVASTYNDMLYSDSYN